MTLHQQIRGYLKRVNRRPNKKLGQHFMINPDTLREMVQAADLTDADAVLEIGAGLGFLTSVLAANARRVIAVEFDPVLYTELQIRFRKAAHVKLVQGDILKLDLATLLGDFPPGNTKVIANLPYYITTPVLWKLLERRERIGVCVLTLQAEVAERLVASPGDKKRYGALSVGVSYYAQAEIIKTLPPEEFYPSPTVHSAVVKLEIRDAPPVTVDDEALLFRIVRAAFQSRRKTLRNALLRSGVPIAGEALDASFAQVGIDSRRRGETLDITEFAALANSLADFTET